MPCNAQHSFRPGDRVVHRRPNQTVDGGLLFGAEPRHVATVTDDTVFVTIDGDEAAFHPEPLNYAPGMKVSDPLGRVLTVVHEAEPAPAPRETRVARGGTREWVPTDLLVSVPTEAEVTIWGVRTPSGSITWADEDTARSTAAKHPNTEVLTLTGSPIVVDRTAAAGPLALVDLDDLRRAAHAGPTAVAALISRLDDKGDFLTEVEEALHTPAGIHRLISERRGTIS